jgi:hypothetical protein
MYYKGLGLGRAAYKKINGHTNLLYGWGADDDDLLMRISKTPDVQLITVPIIWNWYYDNFVERCIDSDTHPIKLKKIYDNPQFNPYDSGLNTLKYTHKIKKIDKNIYRAIIDEL